MSAVSDTLQEISTLTQRRGHFPTVLFKELADYVKLSEEFTHVNGFKIEQAYGGLNVAGVPIRPIPFSISSDPLFKQLKAMARLVGTTIQYRSMERAEPQFAFFGDQYSGGWAFDIYGHRLVEIDGYAFQSLEVGTDQF
jgi:hypothetical protein